jgi:hypothetical protein
MPEEGALGDAGRLGQLGDGDVGEPVLGEPVQRGPAQRHASRRAAHAGCRTWSVIVTEGFVITDTIASLLT